VYVVVRARLYKAGFVCTEVHVHGAVVVALVDDNVDVGVGDEVVELVTVDVVDETVDVCVGLNVVDVFVETDDKDEE